jgi:hypothetical protein
MARSVVDALLTSDELPVRWKVRVRVLGEDPDSPPIRRLQEEIRHSPTVRHLLEGHAARPERTYSKWRGSHWMLIALADLGYPAGDTSLLPLRDEVQACWLDERYFREYVPAGPDTTRDAVPVVGGRYRQHASQQGGALLAVTRLGLDDGRTGQLAERLQHWQWPDGGWNCDRAPGAACSSVYETLLPLRGLAAYAAASGDTAAHQAAGRAAEVLLDRRLLFRRSTGRLIRSDWRKLHYPVYWHYDVLAALKGLAEAGRIDDPRCDDGLNLLQRKELPCGGWAAEAAYHRTTKVRGPSDYLDWGGVNAGRMNEWVTADALSVLAAAGRGSAHRP